MPTKISSPIAMTSQELSSISQIAGQGSSLIDTSDPLSKNYQTNMMLESTGKGLSIGLNPALMAATGGLSAPIGAVLGGAYGSLTAPKRIEEAKILQETNKSFDTRKEAMLNELSMQEQEAPVSPVKMLTSIEGNVPHNKSARQHSSDNKMNAIAMSGITSKY
jgi:gas vesicle protein